MKADILSPSGLDTYITCPKSFEFKVNRVPQRPSTGGHVGTVFHLAMESLIDCGYALSYKDALRHILLEQDQVFHPSVIVEAIEIGEKFLKFNPLPRMEDIYATEATFGPPGATLAGKPVSAEIDFKTGLRMRGIIDIVWLDNGTIVVGDYKTQRAWVSPEQLAQKVQAMAYALVVHHINPKASVRVEFYMARYPEDGPVVWAPDPDSFDDIEKLLWSYQLKIRKDADPVATPTQFCRWCNWSYTCKPYKNWAKVANGNSQLWEVQDLPTLVKELDTFYNISKATEKTTEMLRERVQNIMERENIDEYGRWNLTRTQRNEYLPEAEPIIASLGGRKNLSKEDKIRLKPYQHKVWTAPSLKCNWRKNV